MAALLGFEAQRDGRVDPLLARCGAAIDALNVAGFAAQRRLALGFGAEQLGPEQVCIRGAASRWEIDPAAGEVRVLVQDNAEQTDGRGLRDGGRLRVPADGLRAAGDEIKTELRHWHRVLRSLREMEQR